MSAEKRLQRKLDRMGKKSGNTAEVEDGKLEVNEFIQDNSKGRKQKRAMKLAGWGVRCTKAGGPGKFGGKKK